MYSQNKFCVSRLQCPSFSLSKLYGSIALLGLMGLGSVAHALESMNDTMMSDTTGGDGVLVNIQASKVTFDNLYYKDQIDTSGNARQLQLTNATLTPNSGSVINASATINTGSNGTTPALNLTLNVSPFLLAAPKLEICLSTASCSNNPIAVGTAGTGNVGFAFQTTKSTAFSLVSTNGLFNSAGTAKVTLLLDGANAFFSSNGNQIVAADIRANISATGSIWIDATDGFRFGGNVALIAANAARSGIQASLVMQSGTGTTYNPATAGGFFRVGASGNLLNTQLSVRGVAGTNANEDSVGSVIGSQGIVARLTAQTQSGALNADGTGNGFQLEFSSATPTAGYGIQMTNFVGFSNVVAAAGQNPTIDSGNLYLNLISNTDLTMPTQTTFTSPTMNTVNFFNMTASTFTQAKATDTQLAGDNALVSIRGLNIQGVPLQTFFYQTGVGRVTNVGIDYDPVSGVAKAGTTPASSFALMPVLNNVNANIAINGQPNAIGYSLALSTTGTNGQTGESGAGSASDISTTSLFLADTSNKQYLGLRNIDLFLQADGLVTLTTVASAICANDCINISLNHLLLAVKTGFAAGYLPGAEPTGFAKYADANNTDTLFNISAAINGASGSTTNAISLYTNSNGSVGFGADLTLAGTPTTTGVPGTGTSFLRLSQPCTSVNCSAVGDGATLGLDNLTGRIQIAAPTLTTPGSYISADAKSATIATTLNINPDRIQGQELLGTLDFYADSNTATAQPLGKFVVTGAQIISKLTIAPVSTLTHF
jgi:hypothetical protein